MPAQLSDEVRDLIIEQALKECSSIEDVQNYLKNLTGPVLEKMLEGEMDNHLWYAKHDPVWNNSGNSRNGKRTKTVTTTSGSVPVSVPRDRNASFQPTVLEKYATNTSEVEQKIINMYGLWLSTRQIQDHVMDIYWASISPAAISRITDQIVPVVQERQNRPLQACYPVLFLDAIHCKVKENGTYKNKAVYLIVGYDLQGHKDVLGFYIAWTESAKFWMMVCNNLKNRGVQDVCICCIDWLHGFGDAIRVTYPDVQIQRCVVHLIRNSCRYVSHKDSKAFMADLKWVYKAETEQLAKSNLDAMVEQWWDKYGVALQSWTTHWSDISTYFVYPHYVRKIIYTTNIIESNNATIRKTVKKWDVFVTEQALLKKMYLAVQRCTRKWTMPVHHWWQILTQLQAFFPEIMEKHLVT